jgi:hypothetical protein
MMSELDYTARIALENENHASADLSCGKCHLYCSNEKRRFLSIPSREDARTRRACQVDFRVALQFNRSGGGGKPPQVRFSVIAQHELIAHWGTLRVLRNAVPYPDFPARTSWIRGLNAFHTFSATTRSPFSLG